MTLTVGQVYTLARGVGLTHDAAVTAVAVAVAESGLDPSARGDVALAAVSRTWGPSLGLWQIRSLRAEKGTGRSRDGSRLLDPGFNARAMATISNGGRNWTPWSTYTSGAYRSHLRAVRAVVGAGGGVDLQAPSPTYPGTSADSAAAVPAGLSSLNPLSPAAMMPVLLTGAAVSLGLLLVVVGVRAVAS